MKPIEKAFSKMGARIKIKEKVSGWRSGPFVLDIKKDKKGEYFELEYNPDEINGVDAVDVRPEKKHLLLMVRHPGTRPHDPETKEKFLCGHDELHWFAAGVRPSSSSVLNAMESLKPSTVLRQQEIRKVKTKKRNKRKNEAFIRQGEWFFIPSDIKIDEKYVLKNEPLQRGAGKPHVAEYIFRVGGRGVYVNGGKVVTENEYERMDWDKKIGYVFRRADANVYARGSIRHPDHKTIYLSTWHQVVPNEETRSSKLAFID